MDLQGVEEYVGPLPNEVMTGEERQRASELLARMQRAVVHLWGRDPDLDNHVRTIAHDIRELKRLLELEQTPERKD